MTKLEELKAAYEAAELGDCDLDEMVTPVAQFVFAAYNLMPQLLEAVDLLETLRYSMSQYDGEWFLHEGSDELIAKVDDFMEKLK